LILYLHENALGSDDGMLGASFRREMLFQFKLVRYSIAQFNGILGGIYSSAQIENKPY